MLPFPIQVQLPFPFDSFGSLMFVLSIAATFGLRYARNRTSTLVIQKFHIAVEPLPTALPAELWPMFRARYIEALLPQLKDTRPYFYPFKRVLLWGER